MSNTMETSNNSAKEIAASEPISTMDTLLKATTPSPCTQPQQARNTKSGAGEVTFEKKADEKSHKRPPKKKQKTKAVAVVKKEDKNSEIWNHFVRIKDSDPPRAACKYCDKTYAAHPKFNGTSSMWAHLETSCKSLDSPFRLDKSQKTITEFKSAYEISMVKGKTLNIEEHRTRLAKIVIVDAVPFRFVEGEAFRAFVEGLEPRFKVPSRHTVARDCLKIFEQERKKLKSVLKNQRVCLTTDTWTSLQNLNYMCLTAHWISNEWKLEKRIINFCIVENHKGETIAKQIEECLIGWGIDKVFTITVDNATSNDKALSLLKKKCKWKDVILNNGYMQVRCCAHVVNLIVKEGLEEQNEAIIRIRNAVRYVRSSPARLKAFKKCVEKEKIESKSLLCLDVETRWNSTYLMLEAAEKFEKAFERLGDEDDKFADYFDCYEMNQDRECDGRRGKVKANKIIGPPAESDWTNARNFVKFLKIFYNVTLKFSGSLYSTSNVFFRELASVHIGISTMIKRGDYHMASMALRMKDKFNKYWGNIDNINWLLVVAIVLDPRYKLKYVNFCFATIYDGDAFFVKRMTDKVEEMLNLLYKCYGNSDTSGKDQSVTEGDKFMDLDGEYDPSELLESQFARHLAEEQSVENKTEVAIYLLDVFEKPGIDFDLLNWWKVNSPKYPILSKVAKDVLAIPVSTIASESAFSTSGRVIDSFRSSLSPKTVEALVCAQDWLRVAPCPIDLNAIIEDMENFEEFEKELSGALNEAGCSSVTN